MAIRESDVNVRISSINILTLIHQIGLLDDEERDQLSLLIYCDIPKVRRAIAPFVKISLEDFIKEKRTKVQTLLVSSGTKRKRNVDSGSSEESNATKQSWVSFKCLAEFFVNCNKVLEDTQKANEQAEDEIGEAESDDGALIRSIGNVESSRIGLSVQDLWGYLDALKEWQKLADYLSKDHSSTSQNAESPNNGNSSNAIEEFYRLGEKEESALVEVFVKCLQLSLSENLTPKDKKKADGQIDETRAEISRTMITVLPRLLTKYAPDAGRIAEVLQIPQMMDLSVYSDLRMQKAYELLVEDVKKLFLKHTHSVVLVNASATFQYMRQFKNFASTVETSLGELQDEVTKNFLDECENNDLSVEDLTSDQVHSLSVALGRLEHVITVINVMDTSEENDDVYECIIKLVGRGLLGNYEEEKMVTSAINFLWYYLLWKVEYLSSKEHDKNVTPDTLDNFIVKRDQIIKILFDVGVSVSSGAQHTVRLAAFRALGNIYWLFSSDLFHNSGTSDLSKLRFTCQPDIQEKIEKFVAEEIEMATKNIDMVIEPEEKFQIMEIIGTLLRGVRGGWFHASHAASVICQFGTLGGDLDDVIKKLMHEFRERMSSEEAKLHANVFISSLKKSHMLYSRDTHDVSSSKDADHIIELQREGIAYVFSSVSEYQRTDNNDAIPKMIKFFKILGMLLVEVGPGDACEIESILKEELESQKVDVNETEKQWEPYYSYFLKVNSIAKKGTTKKGNAKSSLRKKRPSDPKRKSRDHHVDSNSENQENNEEIIAPSSNKLRNGNIAPSSFGDEDANNSLDNSEMPLSIKRSAPVDDDIEITESPPKKRRPTTERKTSNEEPNEEVFGNGNSDRESVESFQSVSDRRNKKRVRR
ncbi:9680_t:CDS:10 [Acaulospora colombiana]|uniref:9680_t:CDS:1 n=1 Tax=Acaulospora colombiana TaxID=27376 RepID=A0ACA9KHV4_9GLOM|nr:9680_t:CDS:10 [Acaulospora colombiana]